MRLSIYSHGWHVVVCRCVALHDSKLRFSGLRLRRLAAAGGARAAADERRAALQAEADTEIAEMRRSAQAEIDEARAEALSGMRGDVSSLAVGAAQIVLGRDLDAGNQQSVIDQALSAD